MQLVEDPLRAIGIDHRGGLGDLHEHGPGIDVRRAEAVHDLLREVGLPHLTR